VSTFHYDNPIAQTCNKVLNFSGAGRAREAALKSIKTLGLDYLDLYLIHWPGSGRVQANSPENSRLRKESWMDLVQLNKEGKLRSVGVSNYTIRHLKELFADCGGVRPAVNQVCKRHCQ